MTEQLHIPDPLQDLPPAPKLVYLTIADHSPRTTADIIEVTGLSRRTVNDAAETLNEAGAIRTISDPTDGRRNRHHIQLAFTSPE